MFFVFALTSVFADEPVTKADIARLEAKIEQLIAENQRLKAPAILLNTREQLARAIDNGDKPLLNLLIQAGLDVNVRYVDGSTPLHYAVKKGDFEIIKILFDAGANQNIKNNYGYSPLSFIGLRNINEEKIKIIEYFLENGADVNLFLADINVFEEIIQNEKKDFEEDVLAFSKEIVRLEKNEKTKKETLTDLKNGMDGYQLRVNASKDQLTVLDQLKTLCKKYL